jgi:hypothetical protein
MPDLGDGGGRPEVGYDADTGRPPDKTLALRRFVVKGV